VAEDEQRHARGSVQRGELSATAVFLSVASVNSGRGRGSPRTEAKRGATQLGRGISGEPRTRETVPDLRPAEMHERFLRGGGSMQLPRRRVRVGLTFEFTRVRKRAKPAVARRVQRRVGRHPRKARMNSSAETPAWRRTPARVPVLSSLCIGSTQPFDSRFMTTWLPLWRTF
jgi:hypothetical protein